MSETGPKKLLYTHQLSVLWGDMDALGHVNNTIYFRYMEQARISWLATAEFGVSSSEEGPVLVSTTCDFIRPIVFPAKIEVLVYSYSPGRSSFPVSHIIRDAADPACIYAEGKATVVWVSRITNRSTPIPDKLRQLLSA